MTNETHTPTNVGSTAGLGVTVNGKATPKQLWEECFVRLVHEASDCNYAIAQEVLRYWLTNCDDWRTTQPEEAAAEALSRWFDVDA